MDVESHEEQAEVSDNRHTAKTDVFVARSVAANRGDLASQAGIVQGLLAFAGVGTVYVSTYYPHHFSGMLRVRPLAPPPVRGYGLNSEERDVLSTDPLVVWGGGVDMQDSGSKLKLPLLSLRLSLLTWRGKRLVLVGQGAGPIRSRWGRMLLFRVARRFNRALVREPTAGKLLIQLGGLPPDRVGWMGDGALMLNTPDPGFGRSYLAEKGLNPAAPILGVNIRRWYHQKGGWLPTAFWRGITGNRIPPELDQVLDHMARAVAEQSVAGQVLLVPMYRHEPEPWEDDIRLLEELATRLPSSFRTAMLEEDVTTAQLLSILACTTAVMGVRLHSTLLAHVAGVPALHIAYDHKGREYFQMMNMTECCLDIDEVRGAGGAEILGRKVDHLLANRDALAAAVSSRVATLRADGQRALHDMVRSMVNE